jgi:hypothetical protein
MYIGRRSFILGAAVALAPGLVSAQDADGYIDFEFKDIFDTTKGTAPDIDPNDLVKVGIHVANGTKVKDHVAVMEYLASIATDPKLGDIAKGTDGEYFNARWKKKANPLIVKFFHDIGYKKTPMPGDCTAWCAATVSWALRQAGKPIPPDPASSQSFLNYGHKLGANEKPKRGDICVFTHIDDASHGHVGLWHGTAGAGSLKLLAGNQHGVGTTNCKVGYPQSRIDELPYLMNKAKDPKVSGLFLNAIVRPPPKA